MSKLGAYLEEVEKNEYSIKIAEVIDDVGVDLGRHAKERTESRHGFDKNILIKIARKIIPQITDKGRYKNGEYGFVSQRDNMAGVFVINNNPSSSLIDKLSRVIKFKTVFPKKNTLFFNDIKGAIVFNEEEK